MGKLGKTLIESISAEPTKEIKIIKESEGDVHKVKECLDDIDMITALEGDTLMIEDEFDWEKVKELAADFAMSQGFYGRLLRDMTEYEESVGGPENIEYPIYM